MPCFIRVGSCPTWSFVTNSFQSAWFGEFICMIACIGLLSFPVWTDRHLFPHPFTDGPLGCFRPLVENSCISVKACLVTPTFQVCGWTWLSSMVAGCYSPGAPLGCFPGWLYQVLFSPVMPRGSSFLSAASSTTLSFHFLLTARSQCP